MLFTFKRDDEGRETIEVNGLAITRITNGPEGFEWLNSMPGITVEHVHTAAIKADEAGFWGGEWCNDGISEFSPTPSRHEVTVDVLVSETTVLSVTIEGEDQS